MSHLPASLLPIGLAATVATLFIFHVPPGGDLISPWGDVVLGANNGLMFVVCIPLDVVRYRKTNPSPTRMAAPPAPTERVMQLARAGRKIRAIKLYREETGLGLKDSKDAVENCLVMQNSRGAGPEVGVGSAISTNAPLDGDLVMPRNALVAWAQILPAAVLLFLSLAGLLPHGWNIALALVAIILGLSAIICLFFFSSRAV